MNPYTSLWAGVHEGDGPRTVHLVLLDNGRSVALSDEVGRSASRSTSPTSWSTSGRVMSLLERALPLARFRIRWLLGLVGGWAQERAVPAEPEVPRAYRRSSVANLEQVREMLVDRLVDYRAAVHSASEDCLSEVLAELISGPVVLPPGLPRAWLPELSEVADPREASCVIASSTVSCAETGTIILTGRPDEGRREISLIPDHHICLVPASSVVELFPEAWSRVTPDGPITMISGPSATSDIELERVEGVHGPRRLDVVIVD